MTTVIASDENNDLFIGNDGALGIRSGLLAVLQACEQAAKTQLGEMVFAIDGGIPNFGTVWRGPANRAQFEAYLRRALMAVQDVIEIPELETVAANNVLTYRATIRTIYGLGAING